MNNEDVIKKIKTSLPDGADISDYSYEGSEIILYTKNDEFFRTSTPLIKKIVSSVKKRIEVRSDPKIVLDQEETKDFIQETVPEDAGIRDVYFEPEFARVVIHAEKPGLVIGKSGETLLKIKNHTKWSPDIRRAPVIDSEIIRSIRKMLHKEAGYRKKFLNKLGERIYSESKDVDWIRLTGLGACREVGRSCFIVQTPQSRVMLDCGLSVSMLANKPFPFLDAPEANIQNLDAVVLTHAHLDHSGVVPFLYEYGYRGPLYCTRPTRDISVLIQMDYIQICQKENKKPLYSSKGIEEAIKHCVHLDYGEVTDITPDIRLTLQNAGHLLGSATAHLHIGDGLYNILYTGDIKYEDTKMFDRTSTDYARVETVLLDSTYGKKNFDSYHKEGEKDVVEKVRRAINRDGRVIIPSFAVGRGQDIITIMADSDLDVPIYLDGMLWDATAIHTAYPEFMSKYMQTKILHKGQNPFIDERLKGIGSHKERLKVLDRKDPYVAIATSGMLVGGPAIEYLYRMAEDPKSMLLFVGYQAEGTLGRRIQKGWKRLQLSDGREMELKLEIDTAEGLGGHSDHRQTLSFLRALRNKPRKVITIHGDGKSCIDVARSIHSNFRIETQSPKNLETIRLY